MHNVYSIFSSYSSHTLISLSEPSHSNYYPCLTYYDLIQLVYLLELDSAKMWDCNSQDQKLNI